jgi:hypothetical protein
MVQISPALQAFYARFQSDAGQDYGAEMVARVQRHLDAQAVVAAQEGAYNNFVDKITGFKNNLVSMVRRDPHTTDLALDLTDIQMRHLTGVLGHDQDSHDALLGHMQGEIAHAAVQGMANRDADAARELLGSSRIADLIPDDQKAGLGKYIDVMDQQRAVDNQARQAEVNRQLTNRSNQQSARWLNGLTDPTTGQLQFPDNWSQRMTQDPNMSPHDKAALQVAYGNLLANGNPVQSDPHLVAHLLDRAALPHNDPDNPSTGEILGHVGDGLNMADAKFIASRSGPQPPLVDASTSRIAEVLSDARTSIDNPGAFGRFVNWLLPAVQQGGNLDPSAKEYLLTPERLATFQPTGDEVIAPARQGFAMSLTGGNLADRKLPAPSLGDIFSGAWQDLKNLPGAIAHGAETGWANRSPEDEAKAAGEAGYANPWPVQGANHEETPQRETMATPANPEDLTLSDGTNVGSVSNGG